MTLFRSTELQNLNPVEEVLSMAKKSINMYDEIEIKLKMAA